MAWAGAGLATVAVDVAAPGAGATCLVVMATLVLGATCPLAVATVTVALGGEEPTVGTGGGKAYSTLGKLTFVVTTKTITAMIIFCLGQCLLRPMMPATCMYFWSMSLS